MNNPHDNFTNLTVKWFRNNNTERLEALTIEVTNFQNQFQLYREELSVVGMNAANCSYGPLYRDPFTLVIHNFTSDKNGYYWCQIFVNHSVSQPLQYAWFFAADRDTCVQQHQFFKRPSEPQCAEFYLDTIHIYTEFETSTGPGAESEMNYLFYIIGFLVVFLLLAISLLTIILFYCFKNTRKDYKSGKYTILA